MASNLLLRVTTAVMVALLTTLAQTAMAQEYAPITGAFGFELGQVVDEAALDYSQKTEPGPLGIVSYRLVPPKPSRFFSTYDLAVASDTMHVVLITAMSDSYQSKTNLKEDLNELMGVLEDKYGPFKEHPELVGYRLECEGKSIDANIILNRLTITYRDDEAYQARKEEKKANDQDAL